MLRACVWLAGVAAVAHAIGETALDVDAFSSILTGVGKMFDPIATEDIDSELLMGRWHQMYKAAINFDVFRTQMYCPVAYFKPNLVMGEGGFTIEEAYRVISKAGPIETYKRDVRRTGPGQYWMYPEEYFYPSQFHVIAAGPRYMSDGNGTETTMSGLDGKNTTLLEDMDVMTDKPYEYIVATDGNRLRLEVYARDPAVFMAKYNNDVLEFVRARGFGGGSFWNAPQAIYQGADCTWPSQREVFARRVLRNQQQQAQKQQLAPIAGSPAANIGESFLAGVNPQAAISTFQGLFGERPIQPQFNAQGELVQPPPVQTFGSFQANPSPVRTPHNQRPDFSTFRNGPAPQFAANNQINRN